MKPSQIREMSADEIRTQLAATRREVLDLKVKEAAKTAGRIGVKVWICKKDDYQPVSQPSGRRERERKPSHAPNA